MFHKLKGTNLTKKVESKVFIGYSSISKAYKKFQPQNGKILVSKNVKFIKDQHWNWEDLVRNQLPEAPQLINNEVDEICVRGKDLHLIFIKGAMWLS